MVRGQSRLVSGCTRAQFPALAMAGLAVALLVTRALAAPAGVYARPSAISVSDLYREKDIPIVTAAETVRWRPPTPAYIAGHLAEPELPEMRAEFAIWLESLLAPQWRPAGLAGAAPYLRRGTGRESRWHSHFYAAYEVGGTEALVQGFLDFVQVTMKPPSGNLSAAVAADFSKAAALDESRPAGQWAVGSDYSGETSPELKSYLRGVAEHYVNPLSLPDGTESTWDEVLTRIETVNGGFTISWMTAGYKGLAALVSRGGDPDLVPATCLLWTNGRVVRLRLEHDGIWAHDLAAFADAVPPPVRATVAPLNSDAVELWDMAQWRGTDGPVDDPARAVTMVARVVVKAPYAPRVGAEEPGADANGQPSWGNQVNLPMTDLKWHVAEFAALAGATQMAVHYHGAPGPTALGAVLVASKDRARDLAQAKETRDNLQALADRYAALRYPPEVSAEREALLSALRDGVRAWDMTLAYWQPIVQQPASTDEAYYANCTGRSERELKEAGLWGTEDRIGAASDVAAPLFRKFGLQN
jgi:hypothetical protein